MSSPPELKDLSPSPARSYSYSCDLSSRRGLTREEKFLEILHYSFSQGLREELQRDSPLNAELRSESLFLNFFEDGASAQLTYSVHFPATALPFPRQRREPRPQAAGFPFVHAGSGTRTGSESCSFSHTGDMTRESGREPQSAAPADEKPGGAKQITEAEQIKRLLAIIDWLVEQLE